MGSALHVVGSMDLAASRVTGPAQAGVFLAALAGVTVLILLGVWLRNGNG